MQFATTQDAMNTVWMLICAALVFFLQAGFCCMECGLSRSKNSINAAIKNVADFCLAGALFWLTGYAFMFGKSFYGLFGITEFFFEETYDSTGLTVFFIYQVMFCGTCSTIASGAVSERMRFKAYACMSVLVGGIIYPIFGHWVWTRPSMPAQGWLANLGFIDFAGSTVVHSLAGWVALAAVIHVGPRVGKFLPSGRITRFHGHSLPIAALGLFILWFGWFGFTGGRAMELSGNVPKIWINTLLASIFGGAGNLLWQLATRKRIDITSFMNGIIAGLVAICATCNVAWDFGAVFIGISAGLIMELASDILERYFKLDDVVNAISVHGVAGAWGTLLVAFVTPPEYMPVGWSRVDLLLVQILGISVCFLWSFGLTWVALSVLKRFMPLRVTLEEEEAGLNVAEHDARTDLHDLLVTMEQNMRGDHSRRAAVDECTEAGMIAKQYNRVLEAREQSEAELRRYATMLEETNSFVENQAVELQFQAEAIETARSEAERANHTKSQFVANMSHEIRTPMTAILGYVDMLLDDDDSHPVSEKWKQPLATIKSNGQHLLEIINDILDISKIEAGKLTIEIIECSVPQLVGDVSNLLRHRAEGKGLALAVKFNSPIPETIHSDPTRIRQVLLNLLGNSIKFTNHGEVRVELEMIYDDPKHPQLQLSVVDSGIGMDDEQISRLFQPFVQADSSTTRRFGGTGLGLTITKRLAEMLGGSITVKSQLGHGSSFIVRIASGNIDGVKMIEKPDHYVEYVPKKPKKIDVRLDCRILLAEDGPDNQRLISLILRKAGAEVVVAENGQIAVDAALRAASHGFRRSDDPQGPFDVILMDMQMPVLDGCGATKKLRQAGYPGPIVALTANAMKEDHDRCMAAGCNDFATKPIDRSVLLATIDRWAQWRRDNVPPSMPIDPPGPTNLPLPVDPSTTFDAEQIAHS